MMPNPNQTKKTLSVKLTRCSSKVTLTDGILFFLVASALFGVRVARLSGLAGFALIPIQFYWLHGYPVLIGIWTMVVGCVGICASNPRRSENKCMTITFGVFCISLIATKSYFIDDFRLPLERAIKIAKLELCDNSHFYTNCYFDPAVYGFLILSAAITILHCIWCLICCLGSLLCATDVQQGPQDGEQQVPQPYSSQDMMMQNQPAMYNPGLQASTDNLQGNAPMPYNSGAPIGPTMQGNMQMQGNAPVPYNGPPIDPTMQGNMQMQGNAPMPYNSGAPIGSTMQGNVQMQGNAPVPYNGPPIDPTMQANMQAQQNANVQQPNTSPVYPTLQENKESVQGNAI